ncbi:MAG TPA: gephyrin-like molybdotransferase Glp [Pantanalinema sp.]
MIPVEEARRLILSTVSPMPGVRTPLLQALGRVLAEPVDSPHAHPPFDNSAMDGYAVRAEDLALASPHAPVRLSVRSEVAAGWTEPPELAPVTACRIMTGAIMPSGADAVVKVEETRESDGHVTFARGARVGQNVRLRGEDLTAGARVLEPGTLLNAARIGLLAGVGRSHVEVHPAVRVAIVATGDELVEPGSELAPGQIYGSNAYALAGMVLEAGAVPVLMGIARDDRQATLELVERALSCDVVITSGGVSVGAFDHVGETFSRLGSVHFDRVAQQPGKPFTYATLAGKPAFGLPGNPVSAMVAFEYYVRPALLRMMAHPRPDRPTVRSVLTERCSKSPGRTAFLRAVVRREADGYRATLTGPQGSGRMTSMAAANALLVIPAESAAAEAGEAFETLLLGD